MSTLIRLMKSPCEFCKADIIGKPRSYECCIHRAALYTKYLGEISAAHDSLEEDRALLEEWGFSRFEDDKGTAREVAARLRELIESGELKKL